MSRWRLTVLVLLLALAMSAQAGAKEVTGLDIQMEPPETWAVAGQLYEGRLQILAAWDLDLTEFTIEGENWRNLTWTPVGAAWVGPDQPLTVEFSGIPLEAAAPLKVIVRSGQKAVARSYIMGGEELEKMRAVRPARAADFPVPEPRIDARVRSRSPQPVIPRDSPPVPDKEAQGYNIRVRGRFIYLRDGTTVIGADGLTVRVYDDDAIIDDLLGTSIK